MEFNMAKCNSLRVTEHQHHQQIVFDNSQYKQTFENIQSAKYFGITINDSMDWVSTFQKFLPKQFRPKLEYAAHIWSPYSKLQINQIEKVQ